MINQFFPSFVGWINSLEISTLQLAAIEYECPLIDCPAAIAQDTIPYEFLEFRLWSKGYIFCSHRRLNSLLVFGHSHHFFLLMSEFGGCVAGALFSEGNIPLLISAYLILFII